MKKKTAHKIINPILFVLILNQAVTALLHSKIPMDTFETIHEGGGFILAGLVIIHLILNFNWIKLNYFHK